MLIRSENPEIFPCVGTSLWNSNPNSQNTRFAVALNTEFQGLNFRPGVYILGLYVPLLSIGMPTIYAWRYTGTAYLVT